MFGQVMILFLVMYAWASEATEARAASHPREARPYVFLQMGQSTQHALSSGMNQLLGQGARSSVPSDFFEDALPVVTQESGLAGAASTPSAVARSIATAPFDVGGSSVPFEETEVPNARKVTFVQEPVSHTSVSLLGTQGGSEALSSKVATVSSQDPDALMQYAQDYAHRDEQREEARQEAFRQQQEKRARDRRSQDAAKLQQQEQKQLLIQRAAQEVEQEEEKAAATPTVDPATEAEQFFESQGDVGGQDSETAPARVTALEQQEGGALEQFPASPTAAAIHSSSGVIAAHGEEQNVQLMQAAERTRLQDRERTMQQEILRLRQEQEELKAVERAMLAQRQLQNLSTVYPSQHQALDAPYSQEQTLMPATNPASLMDSHGYGPAHHDCTPQCSYKCDSPKCNEVCSPVCRAPVCQTRCAGADLSACHMQCGKPQCSIACPSTPCTGVGCPSCKTQCSEPMCMLQCPKAQPCHNVCEQPQCEWKCSAPTECPKPKCQMECEAPQKCVGSTYRQLPPLQAGESLVQSFETPNSLAQRSSTLRADSQVPMRRSQLPTLSVPVETMPARRPRASAPVTLDEDFLAPERQQLLQRLRTQRQQLAAASAPEQRTLEMPVLMANS